MFRAAHVFDKYGTVIINHSL